MAGKRVVIIGAGVVGAALADELTARGWDEVTVVDKGALPTPGGSSSHAPGLVFQTNGSRTMAELARYTVEKFSELHTEEGPCFLPVGGLEVATSPERLAELHRRAGWNAAWGIDCAIVSPQRCQELWPMLDVSKVYGGLHVPGDGIAKAVRGVTAQLDRAVARGARLVERTEVLDVHTENGVVTGVSTDAGELAADVVVCCAGIWGPKVAAMVGLSLPLTPLAHQLAWTSQVPANAGQRDEAVRPILRNQDGDLYYRERFDGLGIGYYGHRPMPVAQEGILSCTEAEVMPSVHSFTEEDFAPAWETTRGLLPATAEAKIEEGINGLFSFTPDDMPLLGEAPDARGFWVAESVWVTQSAGVGLAMAEWITEGYCSSFDLHSCELTRFDEYQLAPDYVLARDCQNFAEVYDIKHPLQPMAEPRPLRVSPFHARQEELGGYFLEAHGFERPQWYEANANLVEGRDIPVPNDWAARYWSPIVGAEAQYTRERVALYDMTALRRVMVTGPGSAEFLHYMATGNVTRSVGSVGYNLLLDRDGGIRSDVTIARLGREEFQLGVNGHADVDWLRGHAPQGVSIQDITSGTCCLGLWGPLAREVLQPLTTADFSHEGLKFFRGKRAYIGNVPVTALRLSYVGELGWELYTTADLGLKLWDTLWEAGREHGIIAAGRGAFNSLRLEKGYRSFGGDMGYEHDPWEAGVGFAVKEAKAEFFGKDAVLDRKDRVTRRLTCLTLDDPVEVVMGHEPVFHDGCAVGYVTSAAYGYTIGRGIAYAWLPANLTEPGTSLSIRYFDRDVAATVTEEPLLDPEMKRMRC
ncbi:GcvT family protein [Sciscionella sediminilitoris]|uniref:GcvT family protein n=1 Tax=Sciscionella sediminilitoris TaxID=1445613 RepID=UPI0004DF6F64|nr:FAD-dependent oxidoreductase [Sciscionella sp. SE31]